MRVLVHDYSGHPFQVQLSRALAGRGHEVLHVHCASYQTGKGAVTPRPDDPPTFALDAIDLGRTFDRYALVRRVGQELAYGREFSRRAERYRPEVVLSSNDPLFAKARAARWCRRRQVPWVFWLQDIYSVAMAGFTAARFGPPGRLLGAGFQALERRLLHQAAGVVAITEDFRPLLRRWRVDDASIDVIENWAPLDDLAVGRKENEWARAHGLHDRPVLLYSGTLGLKHDPGLLAALAAHVAPMGAQVVVVSEGAGADWLAGEKQARGLANLLLLPYQPFSALPDVLAAADVLLTLLDPDAGVFSVPSKILTYLCAGRPILAAMPAENLGARTIVRAGAGVVVAPDDQAQWLAAATSLLADDGARQRHGAAARCYAEEAFDIDAITDRFETILDRAVAGRSPAYGPPVRSRPR